jgi:hypothetical protein
MTEPDCSANRRFIAAAVAAILVFVCSAGAYALGKGEKSLGFRAGYTSSNRSAVAGMYFQYAFSSHFRLAPDVDYSFRHNGNDAFSINLNAHVPFGFSQNRFAVYPLAGLNYTSWNIHHKYDIDNNDDTKSRVDRLGLNVGAGIGYYAKPSLKLAFEGKYRCTRDYNSGVLTVSIGYVF